MLGKKRNILSKYVTWELKELGVVEEKSGNVAAGEGYSFKIDKLRLRFVEKA